MGCDIHFFVEKRDNGKWQSADTWEDDDGWLRVKDEFYDGRNYDLFSILADVRNGYGFAGSPTGAGFVPIAEPRGVPEDADAPYKRTAAQWGLDGHSHSWFTVAELMAYDWTQTTTKCGVTTPSEFARWKLWGKPDAYSSFVAGPEIQIFSAERGAAFVREDEWINLLRDEAPALAILSERLGCSKPYFTVSWDVHYYEVASAFLGETLPRLWRLGQPDDVRALFFFDN